MEEASVVNKGDDLIDLPPGFRFHPTDEEIITHYLTPKVSNSTFAATAIGEADLNKCEPWDLPKKAKMGEKEWYFFCQRDRKYPTGMRTNRATESGYWKATGKDKEIYKGKACLVGMKKTLVFYTGRAPKGEKTNWVMHEYRLEGKFSYYNLPKAAKDEWVVCRVFHKNTGIKKSPIPGLPRMKSFGDDLFMDSPNSLPPLVDPPNYFDNSRPAGSSFTTDGEDKLKGTTTTPTASSQRLMSDGNYLHYFSSNMMNDHPVLQRQQDHKTFLPPPNHYTTNANYQASTPTNSNFYPQIPLPNPQFPFQASLSPININPGYLHQESSTSGLERQCKAEQISSNQSMVSLSQETGLSTDINTEISSVVSKHEIGSIRSYEDHLEGGPPVGPMADLECLWDFY
ncbi:hypothetical protein L1049_008201 [Liquidambar formosana]|uniref:NAC domain-containing protein n=1 Tax=Liquidambar formosana TaxID=63359 RepID=A0AAP0S640_LIQFO